MSPPEVWGPPVWTLFHALSANINEEQYAVFGGALFGFFKRICMYLPCPDCARDATRIIGKVIPQNISTKQGLIYTMYVLHNTVNKKKHKAEFSFAAMNQYNNMNLITVFNNFAKAFNTNGNMRLIAESFQRKMILVGFRKWFLTNIRVFIRTQPKISDASTVADASTVSEEQQILHISD